MPPEDLPHKLDVLRGHAEAVGRDVAEIEIGNELRGETEESAQAYFDAGVRLFTVGITGPDLDFDAVARWIRWRDARNG